MDAPPPIDDLRVLLVSDDPLVRAGLSHMLDAVVDESPSLRLELARAFDDVHGAFAALSPDVTLADLGVDLDAARARLREVGALERPVVVLVPPGLDAQEVLAQNVRAALSRGAEASAIRAALFAAAAGLVVLDPSLLVEPLRVAASARRAAASAPRAQELTAREMEVLQLLTEALPNKLIADRLGISDHTAKFHVNSVMSKLSAGTRTEAVVRAARLGIVTL